NAPATAVRIEVCILRRNMNRREFIAAAAVSVRTSRLPGATTVIVKAGRFDRSDVVVSFPLPAGVDGNSTVLRDDSGKTILLQIDGDRANFALSDLKAGQSKKYQIE